MLHAALEAPARGLDLGRLRPRRPARPLNLLTPEKVKQGVAEVNEGLASA